MNLNFARCKNAWVLTPHISHIFISTRSVTVWNMYLRKATAKMLQTVQFKRNLHSQRYWNKNENKKRYKSGKTNKQKNGWFANMSPISPRFLRDLVVLCRWLFLSMKKVLNISESPKSIIPLPHPTHCDFMHCWFTHFPPLFCLFLFFSTSFPTLSCYPMLGIWQYPRCSSISQENSRWVPLGIAYLNSAWINQGLISTTITSYCSYHNLQLLLWK